MEIYKKNNGPLSRDTRFVRAYAAETHMDTSQGILEEPFCIEIYKKSAGPGFWGARFVLEFTGKNAHGHFTRAILSGNLEEKSRPPLPGPPF